MYIAIARLLIILGVLSAGLCTQAYAAQIAIACGSYGQEFSICKDGAIDVSRSTLSGSAFSTIAFSVSPPVQ